LDSCPKKCHANDPIENNSNRNAQIILHFTETKTFYNIIIDKASEKGSDQESEDATPSAIFS